MVNEEFVAQMKAGAILVNTARGGLIDSLDPIDKGLREGRLAAVGLDVLPDEPPVSHPLIEAWRDNAAWVRGRFTVTPHTAYYSDSAWQEMRYKAAETVDLYFTKGIIRNRIR
jgi:D-3-phosphoglycerate dehydrogenase